MLDSILTHMSLPGIKIFALELHRVLPIVSHDLRGPIIIIIAIDFFAKYRYRDTIFLYRLAALFGRCKVD